LPRCPFADGGNGIQSTDNWFENAAGGLRYLVIMFMTLMVILIIVVILIMMFPILMMR
jgi:hypothetical protein